MLHDYGSKLPKNRDYFAHIFGGALILIVVSKAFERVMSTVEEKTLLPCTFSSFR